jgi:hypothetical protein
MRIIETLSTITYILLEFQQPSFFKFYLGIDGRIILKIDIKMWTRFNVAQDRDQWRALVDMIMNPWLTYKGKNFLNG